MDVGHEQVLPCSVASNGTSLARSSVCRLERHQPAEHSMIKAGREHTIEALHESTTFQLYAMGSGCHNMSSCCFALNDMASGELKHFQSLAELNLESWALTWEL